MVGNVVPVNLEKSAEVAGPVLMKSPVTTWQRNPTVSMSHLWGGIPMIAWDHSLMKKLGSVPNFVILDLNESIP